MTYVLHYAPDNASLIIRLALDHMGLPYREMLVDRSAQGQRAPAYLDLNPNGLIPVLETPHGPLFETGAILLWLGDRHGGIVPAPDAATRGDFLKWLFYVANTLHPALRMMFYPEKYIGSDPDLQSALRSGLQAQVLGSLTTLETVAAKRPCWLGAAEPSGLDFYIAACLRWCALYPAGQSTAWFDAGATPVLRAICTSLEKLPCTTALQTAEGLGPTPFSAPSYPNPPRGSAT